MKTAAQMYASYHITHSAANEHWPDGMWALYRIDGDQIAKRIQFGDDGKVVRRDSWCGYIGGFGSLAELTAAIESDMAERLARAA